MADIFSLKRSSLIFWLVFNRTFPFFPLFRSPSIGNIIVVKASVHLAITNPHLTDPPDSVLTFPEIITVDGESFDRMIRVRIIIFIEEDSTGIKILRVKERKYAVCYVKK